VIAPLTEDFYTVSIICTGVSYYQYVMLCKLLENMYEKYSYKWQFLVHS